MPRVPIPREKQATNLPQYDALEHGLRDYWYPVMLSRKLRRTLVPMRLFGETVVFVRDRARVFALVDRCPHRGTPLRFAKRDFPGTVSCIYHGWCFDLKTGSLVAALTDGPDCPLVGKVAVKTYPVEDRFGLIWIYMGRGSPPPLEADVPEEFLDPRTAFCIRISEQQGNWRFAVENHFDDSHGQYLHRDALFGFFGRMPSYKRGIRITRNGRWLDREAESVHFSADYPGLGRWPKKQRFWKRAYYIKISVAMPGMGRVDRRPFTAFKFHVPVDPDHFRFVQVLTKKTSGFGAVLFHLRYWAHRRWLYHVMFNNQDVLMTKYSHSGPEYLFRPDISLTAWRKMCVEEARTDRAAAE